MTALDAQVEAPRLVWPERRPVGGQLPALEISHDIQVRQHDIVADQVVTGAPLHFPIGREVKVEARVDDGGAVGLESAAGVREVEVEVQRPRYREIGVAPCGHAVGH